VATDEARNTSIGLVGRQPSRRRDAHNRGPATVAAWASLVTVDAESQCYIPVLQTMLYDFRSTAFFAAAVRGSSPIDRFVLLGKGVMASTIVYIQSVVCSAILKMVGVSSC
jgi:hypothetical protein